MEYSTIDKKHWYDGLFYDKLIAPIQDRLFNEIKKIIEPSSTVVDVGCGTGRFSFQLAEHCKSIVGVDLSSKNISVAESNLKNSNFTNISFVHGNAIDLQKQTNIKFDYAVTTYVIHEMNKEDRIGILNEMKQVANKIIIGDYIVPTPNTFMGKVNVVVEYLAGTEHYNNFKSFVKNGG
ncbi:MAG: class I SAM-dependent methyltransferase, partial [Ignavibacteriae bacterium]|nr:class I SAM-dependent methyltransferase [Ignavibacteriota bacterium]